MLVEDCLLPRGAQLPLHGLGGAGVRGTLADIITLNVVGQTGTHDSYRPTPRVSFSIIHLQLSFVTAGCLVFQPGEKDARQNVATCPN